MAEGKQEKNSTLVFDKNYETILDVEIKLAEKEHKITEENKRKQDRHPPAHPSRYY
jgi:hypothetical protein